MRRLPYTALTGLIDSMWQRIFSIHIVTVVNLRNSLSIQSTAFGRNFDEYNDPRQQTKDMC